MENEMDTWSRLRQGLRSKTQEDGKEHANYNMNWDYIGSITKFVHPLLNRGKLDGLGSVAMMGPKARTL